MHVPSTSRILAAIVIALAACKPDFELKRFTQDTALYEASLRELQHRHWDNAVAGFERLTIELPARDTLMPLALYHLGKARQGKREWLLAAQAFTRLTESFPDDTLGDDALHEAGLSYARLWRKPELDAQYGETAISTLRMMQGMYPNSPLNDEAQREIDRLTDWLALKTYKTGVWYLGRKAYDPAIIYFKDVLRLYPTAPTARDAGIKLVEAYNEINYREEAQEQCASLRQTYPGSPEVREVCGTGPATAQSPTP
ncbi:MAG TPA: outer membrane protein assembly factor BamD [Gemmatimonadaceae bacterium]|nr:outer membrane protein assembly factor BamD [Gemmatimonadaceae bacterium]